jgi:hypothetical protein
MFDGLEILPQVTRDLMDAKEILVQSGWCKGRFEDWRGRVCALGAIRRVPGISGVRRERVVHALCTTISSFSDLVDWNDAPDRTLDDVLALFDQAIEQSCRQA